MLEAIESIRYLGIASLLAILVAGLAIVRLSSSSEQSISAHASSSRLQTILLVLGLVVFSLPFYLWLWLWLLPMYDLPSGLTVLFVFLFTMHLVLIRYPLVPEKGIRHKYNALHIAAGSSIAVGIVILMGFLLFSAQLEPLSKMSVCISFIYSLACIVLYLLTRRRKLFLLFECIYILLFALSIGLLTLQI